MSIEVAIHPTATTGHEFSEVRIVVPGAANSFLVDVNATQLLEKSRVVPPAAMDLLFIASVVYGIDKAVDRDSAGDRWTREIAVVIPVSEPDRWSPVADDLSGCLSFLTGDLWNVQFRAAERRFIQPRPRRRHRHHPATQGHAVSLFSGGLDSFIGAINWLHKHPDRRLYLVGHYDQHVPGPKSDQKALAAALRQHFPGRFDSLHMQIGLREKGADTNFRSRSFLFLALGIYVAEKLGPEVPVFIPENGPIALNIPLTPTRRGSCSTRTAHPHFLSSLNGILRTAGFEHEISNPHEFDTKSEMVERCFVPGLLREHVRLSVSCAKAGHTVHWDNRTARGCGRCVPCLFRRASLHAGGMDTEIYGYDVCATHMTRDRLGEDTLALLSFLRRAPDRREIARMLVSDGPLDFAHLPEYVDVVIRLTAEMRQFFRAKGSPLIRELAGIL